METLIQADIFFFISTLCLVTITAALLVAIYQVIKILRQIGNFLGTISEGTQALSDDLGEVRAKLRDRGVLTGFILSLMSAFVGFKAKRKEKAKRSVDDSK